MLGVQVSPREMFIVVIMLCVLNGGIEMSWEFASKWQRGPIQRARLYKDPDVCTINRFGLLNVLRELVDKAGFGELVDVSVNKKTRQIRVSNFERSFKAEGRKWSKPRATYFYTLSISSALRMLAGVGPTDPKKQWVVQFVGSHKVKLIKGGLMVTLSDPVKPPRRPHRANRKSRRKVK